MFRNLIKSLVIHSRDFHLFDLLILKKQKLWKYRYTKIEQMIIEDLKCREVKIILIEPVNEDCNTIIKDLKTKSW